MVQLTLHSPTHACLNACTRIFIAHTFSLHAHFYCTHILLARTFSLHAHYHDTPVHTHTPLSLWVCVCSDDTLRGLENGMLGETFKTYVSRMIDDWLVQEDYKSRAYEAIEFQYTYWPDPENSSARTQEFINVRTMFSRRFLHLFH